MRGQVRIGVGLVWAAAGVAGLTVLVSMILAGWVEALFDAAVAEGRILPFSGEAGEQEILPAALSCVSVVIGASTALLAYQIQGWVREGHGGWAVPNALLTVLVAGAPVPLVEMFADQRYTRELYGWWYFPFLLAAAAAYTCCLIGATVTLLRWRLRGR
ncbi:MAG TPA: hypothetical protein VGD43_12655 [Micromonospora sp.]